MTTSRRGMLPSGLPSGLCIPIRMLNVPFCNAALASVKELHKHVARHQEQLARFALPTTDISE